MRLHCHVQLTDKAVSCGTVFSSSQIASNDNFRTLRLFHAGFHLQKLNKPTACELIVHPNWERYHWKLRTQQSNFLVFAPRVVPHLSQYVAIRWPTVLTHSRLSSNSDCCQIYIYIYYVIATLTKSLDAAHHRWQRSILGISWKDRITNVEVRTRTGQQTMDNILRAR